MKKHKHALGIWAYICLIFCAMTFVASAQQKLIHYWNFDNFKGQSGPGSPSLILPLKANWSTIDTNKATLSYIPSYKVSSKYQTYWDVVAGEASDTFNAKNGSKTGTATGNFELRFRNPSDSMEALIQVPTTHYKNITIRYGLERTGSGQGRETFDYSTDGGNSWKTTGLSKTSDSADVVFHLVSVSLATDTLVNNNANGFLFRIKFRPPNSASNGNNRIDNLSVEGDTIKAITPPPPPKGQKLIHYWHFNNFTGLTAAGSPSLIVPFHANWSSIDSTKATVAYVPSYAVSAKYATYWDGVAGDTMNARGAQRFQTTGTNNALRVRNPSDSMELRFNLPTNHYKNIHIRYELEKSSTASGEGKQVFDYSTDGGKNWATSGLSIPGDSVSNATWNIIDVNLNADTMVNSNPFFIFRIKFKTNTSGSSGNNRFDNLTVEGDTDTAPLKTGGGSGIDIAANGLEAVAYPNPANDIFTITTASEGLKTISVCNLQGQMLYSGTSREMNTPLNVAGLQTGIYIVHLLENESGKTAIIKLVKN